MWFTELNTRLYSIASQMTLICVQFAILYGGKFNKSSNYRPQPFLSQLIQVSVYNLGSV